jgi:glutaredoxin-related protein
MNSFLITVQIKAHTVLVISKGSPQQRKCNPSEKNKFIAQDLLSIREITVHDFQMGKKENLGDSMWQSHDHVVRFQRAQGMNSWCQEDDF